MPEAVFAAGKTVEQCVDIVETMLRSGTDPVIVTRIREDQRSALDALDPMQWWGTTATWRHTPRRRTVEVAVVAGGTSDLPVVQEIAGVLTALGVPTKSHVDVGIAGLHRLLAIVPELAHADVVIVVAGMEASLPTVVGGLIGAPVIAVPTSVGYGSSMEGHTALLSMLASCAPGVTVVGIDNGYGAASAAIRILGIRP